MTMMTQACIKLTKTIRDVRESGKRVLGPARQA